MRATVRGKGLVSALGPDLSSAMDAVAAGRLGLHRLDLFESSLTDTIRVAQVQDLAVDEDGRCIALADRAVSMALADAGLEPGSPELADCPLFLGTISGVLLEYEAGFRHATTPDQREQLLAGPTNGRVANAVARRLGIGGPTTTLNTACTSSMNAVYQAMLALRRPGVTRALAVGADSLNAITFHGFSSLFLLDPDGCQPFDGRRQGIQVGEGAAAVLLERCEDDDEPVQLELPVSLCEPHHPTATASDGSAGLRVMGQALERAGLSPADVVAIKAHGTGSQDNDLAEGVALRGLFGEPPPFTSLKRYFGHTMGATGLIELAAWLGCLERDLLPACAGFEQPDPEIGLTPQREHGPMPVGAHLLNYFGFGGSMVSLILRWAGR